MTLVRWEDRPGLWPSFRELESEFDRLFRALGRAPWGGWSERYGLPATDVHETAEAYVIEADLPGLTKKDIELSVSEGVVTIRGERKQEREETGAGVHRYERWYGKFERSFTVPANVDATKAEAEYANGVLRITLGKRAEAKPKQIEVKVK